MIIVYDNYNFKDTKRDKVIGHKLIMRAMTTAALIYYSYISLSDLR